MATGKKTGGRTKGTPNKSTAAVKDALQAAFEGIGGIEQLTTWAKADPGEFYKLWAKMLPQEINSKVESHNRTALISDKPMSEAEWESEVARFT